MRRSDRLMAILIALQQQPETAQRLADKFEVNKRTIMRDMQALSEMGIPLYAVPGPAGGFRLMDSFRLPPLMLDSGEALTLLFALNGLAKMSDTPFKHARWTVMDKIRAVLPEETIRQVELEVAPRHVQTPHLSALLALTAKSKWLTAVYRSENHRRELLLHLSEFTPRTASGIAKRTLRHMARTGHSGSIGSNRSRPPKGLRMISASYGDQRLNRKSIGRRSSPSSLIAVRCLPNRIFISVIL